MKAPERLLLRLMNHLADHCKDELILKGGMQLRLLNSPRKTQDLDYAWKGAHSRKVFAQELKAQLGKLKNIRVSPLSESSFNSKGFVLDVEDRETGEKAQIEINVIRNIGRPLQALTTAPLANQFNVEIKVIASLSLEESFSHKIAATLERGLARDFYDLTQLEAMTQWDHATLMDRLKKISVDRGKPSPLTPSQAGNLLRKRMADLSKERIREELIDLLGVDQLTGIRMIMLACSGRIAARLEALEQG